MCTYPRKYPISQYWKQILKSTCNTRRVFPHIPHYTQRTPTTLNLIKQLKHTAYSVPFFSLADVTKMLQEHWLCVAKRPCQLEINQAPNITNKRLHSPSLWPPLLWKGSNDCVRKVLAWVINQTHLAGPIVYMRLNMAHHPPHIALYLGFKVSALGPQLARLSPEP